ncbi:MAG: DMT family transporter, partial [Alphaproteobacteria bacterium]|nr:DMT family transporter [Alphaproteobacteria bacterium]
ALALSLMLLTPMKRFRAQTKLDGRLAWIVIVSGILGMGLGMTFLMIALQHGDSGVVATLAATSPVIMLPLIWIRTREMPSLTAWGGALLVVVGTGLIVNA